MNKSYQFFRVFLFLSFFGIFSICACERQAQKRSYDEDAGAPRHGGVPPLSWQTPDGWTQKSGGNLRLASFKSKNDTSLDVSIVALGGVAGGISANINRWLKQINRPEMNEEELNQFLAKQEQMTSMDGLKIAVVDLTGLQPQRDSSAPSLLAATLELQDRTVFVKMAGTLAEIEKNRGAFRSLCQSLKVK